MEKSKIKAHQLALSWWNSSASGNSLLRGYAICDSCETEIREGEGYLCKSAYRLMGDRTPDLVCEICFDRYRFEPWEGEEFSLSVPQHSQIEPQLAKKQEQLVWETQYNPMGFAMPWPLGWVEIPHSSSMIAAPPEHRIVSGIYSPSLNLTALKLPSSPDLRKRIENFEGAIADRLDHGKIIGAKWIKLASGDDAFFSEFTYTKGTHQFHSFVITTWSSKHLFRFEIAGATEDTDRYERKSVVRFLTNFSPEG